MAGSNCGWAQQKVSPSATLGRTFVLSSRKATAPRPGLRAAGPPRLSRTLFPRRGAARDGWERRARTAGTHGGHARPDSQPLGSANRLVNSPPRCPPPPRQGRHRPPDVQDSPSPPLYSDTPTRRIESAVRGAHSNGPTLPKRGRERAAGRRAGSRRSRRSRQGAHSRGEITASVRRQRYRHESKQPTTNGRQGQGPGWQARRGPS